MSFVLNKMASLFATLVVVGIVLFCSSAAQAHANHDAPAVRAAAEAVATTDAVDEPADGASTRELAAAKDAKDSPVDSGLAGSCCGKGMSNCMTAAVANPSWTLPAARPAGHGRPLEPNAIHGAVVDGPVRPPRALV
ncbi:MULTISPECIES: hypothetical protein [Aureimonas]|uniref:Uncharacterized protein n=2 Tax=Aureimonas TaxID=414371 RepID=A0A1H0HE06_9HYPH|nr:MULTISPECIES: hypothetical protein [Aureimonas]MBB3934643.1 hypothetical protein [Aureimonas phyllosphaerae]MBB3950546.1 hypothetical protein [Aureimonas jatrophae]MBB3958141.1 hypothetical protein [Aureimonas phyllosphaerae]SDO17405.1 hypothetical protein SAMN05192530_10455 [Aureimonas jatrophae]SFE92475.1 hypothetical protein SAMN05216566_101112 [Aureimonas phyllosphaerae]